MPYLIRAIDKPGMAATRAAVRDEHLRYLEPHTSRLLAGGALLADDGSTVLGSLIIIDTDERAEAQALIDDDPFNRSGIFDSVEIVRWRKVILDGRLVGG